MMPLLLFCPDRADHALLPRGAPVGNRERMAAALFLQAGHYLRLQARWQQALSEATLLIFPMHLLVFWCLDLIATRLGHLPEEALTTSLLYMAAKSVLTLGVLVLIFPLFRRMFPWLTGRRDPVPPLLSVLPQAPSAPVKILVSPESK